MACQYAAAPWAMSAAAVTDVSAESPAVNAPSRMPKLAGAPTGSEAATDSAPVA